MRLFEVVAPPTKFAVTQRFTSSYDKFKASRDNLSRKFADFCKLKLEGSPIPNDYAFGGGTPLTGYWHYHIVRGKIIIIYKRVGDTVRFYDVVEHTAYDTKLAAQRLADWCNGLADSDFTELDIQSIFNEPEGAAKMLSPEEKNQLDEIIYDLISGSGFYILKPAVEKNDWSNFFEWLETDMPDLDHEAMFAAYGGAKQLQAFIIHNIVQFGKAKEYQETPLP